jgi:hypothetical protein
MNGEWRHRHRISPDRTFFEEIERRIGKNVG